ncbi:stomatin-4-like [Asterias rubens]|uniref:stomatin-4-like n=1 Tax=Asterias rubens TaxID=7604 RepID=UPI0014552679|nr:stomatin-4-like [Asterias rubens]XP_033630593.1 stomatin-4-like [Asterias rubens]
MASTTEMEMMNSGESREISFAPEKDFKEKKQPGTWCSYILLLFALFLVICTCPLTIWFCFKTVAEYERAIIFRMGRLLGDGPKGPGLFFIIPCIDDVQVVDLRTLSFDVPPQEILSKDSVTVTVDAVVYFRVSNPTMAIIKIENYTKSTELLAATTLRNVLGTTTLAEMLSHREEISKTLQTLLDDATDPWGVKVERVEIKDVRLPQQMQRVMAAEAEATRESNAKVIIAQGEQNASYALKEAADIISQNPVAIKIRYLQTLNTISAEKNSTIIFPMPIDMLSAIMDKK